MKRIKQICALLIAFVLTFMLAFQSSLSVLYAEDLGQSDITMPAVTQPGGTDTAPIVTDTIETVTQPNGTDFTEPVTAPSVSDTAQPSVSDTAQPSVTDTVPAVTDTSDPAVTDITDITDNTDVTDSSDVTDTTDTPAGDDTPALNIFDRIMSSVSLFEIQTILYSEDNAAAIAALMPEQVAIITARIEELCAAIAAPTEADYMLKDALISRLNELTTVICPECFGVNGEHLEGCSLAPDSSDEIDITSALIYQQLMQSGSLFEIQTLLYAEDNAAAISALTPEETAAVTARIEELCAAIAVPTEADYMLKDALISRLNELTTVICPECFGVNGEHLEGCSLAPTEYAWEGLSDIELAAWLMDEANAEAVKAILADETTEEYALFTARIMVILDGEDLALAEAVMAYLTELVEMDDTETLVADEYIYFDLAAGNVEIGKSGYSGKVFVNGVETPVTGDHFDTNKYYIYQSTVANRDLTGYADETAYKDKTGCRVPTYDRVSFGGQAWTDYITNNIEVKEVSRNWETAAGPQRTATPYNITFKSEDNYTANVVIDNIWSSYHKPGSKGYEWRTSGGIGANLMNKVNISTDEAFACSNVKIYLSLKGDSRVGCVHYSAKYDKGNSIIFQNGEAGNATEGSITVADFPYGNWKENHWSSAIGAADSPPDDADQSDGIVISGGIIYAGTTAEDNCTAIGGGGNNYGGVTINGGTVTAVAAGTGTAIGGGIGYSGAGGNTDVIINNGTIYAYNLGLQTDGGDNFDKKFVPSAAIGGGGSKNSAGGLNANITINGGKIYAQSTGGPGIGGGSSRDSDGGGATITINGGTIIAKSVEGYYHGNYISPGVSIGGGTGNAQGGSVKLTITEDKAKTTIRTGSIGGGLATTTNNIGIANVIITGGDITGQVIMKGGTNTKCTFDMSDGRIHGSNVVNGYTITENLINKVDNVEIKFIENNGGAVWMEDTQGVTTITGGTIEDCTAFKGGAVYMKGGTFTMSGGKLINNNAVIKEDGTVETAPTATSEPITDAQNGLGGAVCVEGGTVTIEDGDFSVPKETESTETPAARDIPPASNESHHGTLIGTNTAVYGGGIYVSGGDVNIHGGQIRDNIASSYGGGVYLTGGKVLLDRGHILENTAIDGGGVYLPDGSFTVDCVYHNSNLEYGLEYGMIHGGEIAENKATRNGGGLYMKNDPHLNVGMIRNNEAGKNGGGVCIEGGALLLDSMEMQIYGNQAKNGGGVAVLGGNFTLGNQVEEYLEPNEVKIGMVGLTAGVPLPIAETELGGEEPGTGEGTGDVQENYYNVAKKGGGVYVSGGNVNIYHGYIWGNKADQGGGVYLDKKPEGSIEDIGNFVMNHSEAVISQNVATNGAGIYLYTAPDLQAGNISQNTAAQDGGGIYIYDCPVILKPTGTVNIAENKAAHDGAGIYIYGVPTPSTPSTDPTTPVTTEDGRVVDMVSRSTSKHKIGLKLMDSATGSIVFANNDAKESGGAVCISVGHFYLDSEKVRIIGNTAKQGGGVAVLDGYFNMTKGAIGESGYEVEPEVLDQKRENKAELGGGIYIGNGNVVLEGGTIHYNSATKDGGGVYVHKGTFTMGKAIVSDAAPAAEGTETVGGAVIANNTAQGNGGGGYVSGDFKMLSGTIGGVNGGNKATNGGGIHVNDGNVEIVYGDIEYNTAENDGGGFLISSNVKNSTVTMLSGRLCNNTAGKRGGGMAVESDPNNPKDINVKVGCLLDHDVTANGPKYTIDYVEAYAEYSTQGAHRSCPVVDNNSAGTIGGGFYMNSQGSTLSFYCVEESGNTAAGDSSCWGMDVMGGNVIIGDETYHNRVNHGTGGDSLVTPRGYIDMSSTILVTGGQVDIYGDMTNPYFSEEITVDIENVENDHFLDHRRSAEAVMQYKVHYFENFFGTGLYQAFQYDQNNAVINIQGALFSHPGYSLLGWYTAPKYPTEGGNEFFPVGGTLDLKSAEAGAHMGKHEIGCQMCDGDNKDESLLELYAIWEANGYTVHFEPNVNAGETYDGTMDDLLLTFDEEKSLTLNAFKRPGYLFTGWANEAGKKYDDGAKVLNLAENDGDTVVLYAQWDPCQHNDPNRWTYSVDPTGTTIIRECSCGGQTLTATLYAYDGVYNGLEQPATLVFNDESAWGTDKPVITYTSKWLTNDGISHDAGTFPALSTGNKKPYHAGEYTATISKDNTDASGNPLPVSVSAAYTIAKAEQEPPVKPTYEKPTTANINKLTVHKLADDPKSFTDSANLSHTARAKYRVSYYVGSTLHSNVWQYSEAGNTIEIALPAAYTGYYIEACYEELDDYKESAIVRADAMYYFAGDVRVTVTCDEGIDYDLYAASQDADITVNGLSLDLTTKSDYYLVAGEYDINLIAVDEHNNEIVATKFEKVTEPGNYKITGIQSNSSLTLTIGKTRRKPVTTAQVKPGQVFSPFSGSEANISRDSAFTAAFKIANFDPYRSVEITKSDGTTSTEYYGAYNGLNLEFNNAVPAATTIILVDNTGGSKTYWYYRAASDISTVSLTDFQKMGGADTDKYIIPSAAGTGYVNLDYQFIVDFSQCAGGYASTDPLNMALKAINQDGSYVNIQNIAQDVTVAMATSNFTFVEDTDTAEDLSNSFTCTFTQGGTASKWENRSSALVLKPKENVVIPPDSRIKAVVGGRTTYITQYDDDCFIVPMSLLSAGDKNVTLTLESALFPKAGKNYDFTAEWMISPSKASRSPLSGYCGGSQVDVTFTSAALARPSLKASETQRVLNVGDTLKLSVETKNMEGCTITATVQRKNGNTYIATGWRQDITVNNAAAVEVDIPFGGQEPGSYRVEFTVKRSSIKVMEVPFYLVIKEQH